ncbi:MAG: SH3 domain-containing protein [Rubritepida sp.]|nr:SH3 domain-containing protein [Rubritepida sp.]MCU0943734.1 SH3 domain-containing protein [Rubritepida sp.]
MRALLALLTVLALAAPEARGQSALGGAGSVAPPRPEASRPPAAQAPRPAQPRPAAQGQPARPAQGQGQGQAQRPPGQRPPQSQANRNRPQGQTPAQAQAAAQRRAAAAAAASAAAAAAAAAAAQAAAAPPPPPEPQPTTGSATGLPLPRFTALGSNDVNLRVGPGRRFPVEWRYQRQDLPVMIVREHDEWRRIRDPEGTEGWIAASTLRPGRRTFMVKAEPGGEVLLRRRPEEGAAPVARLGRHVIGRIRSCEAGSAWCEVQVQDKRGYVKRTEVFGVMPEEEIR